MITGSGVQADFSRRLGRIPRHGLGLSVDLYSPDLCKLMQTLQEHRAQPDYLEVFRATSTALAHVRSQLGVTLLTYHGEGLWLTQPEAKEDPEFTREVIEVARQLQILQSAWMNHECATKQMAGYAFGTYLPPVYTASSAEIVADHARDIQDLLDRYGGLANGNSPLVLLELPPLTYFVIGTLSIPAFFRVVAEQTPCGLVLDVGHLWTIYRYTGAWRTTTVTQFVREFLEEFPLERVVEIHVAGLAVHESGQAGHWGQTGSDVRALPLWIDAHAAAIPPVLFDMLDQIVSHPHLTHLKGLALEVDTKPVELIVEEFTQFSQRYADVFMPDAHVGPAEAVAKGLSMTNPVSKMTRHAVGAAYEWYAHVVTGKAKPEGPGWDSICLEELDTYRTVYLPYEILHWGGDLEAMFPQTCRHLIERAVSVSGFVSFWLRAPRVLVFSYDFFLLKIERFVEFVHEEAPDLDEMAAREADELRQAYHSANEPAGAAQAS